ncbi:MAG TPA: AsmA family protein [Candidatus Dormibacteraeota bacterium]|nr:AsmA family protein [Candidatus Dormibacteraeota bacterium]
MRKLGIAIAVIVVLLVAAALIVPHLIDVNQYHGQIQSQLEKRLGRQVTLGKMGLRLFPPAFDVENTTIAEDPQFASGRPFATADKLAVSVKFWPLLRKQLEVNSLELVHPHIELVRNAQGVWNFATLGQEGKPTAAQKVPAQPRQAPTPTTTTGPAGTQPGANQPAGQLTLANLFINDGQVAITDLQKHQSRAVYDHIDLNVNDFAPDQQFSMKLTAHLPGEGKQAIWLEGKGGPIKEADMLNTPFGGTLRLDQVSTAAAQKFLNSQSLNGIDAVITGDAKVKNAGGKLASSGTIRMENAHIHNVNVGYPIALEYDIADDLTNDVIQIHKGNLKLGATPISLAGTVNTRPTPSQIDLKLTASNASIAEMARLASAFGVAFGKDVDVKGLVNANIQARGAMDKPALNGQLSARNLDISGKEIPQPVKVNEITLALTPETVRSNEFAATTGSTTVNVSFALSQYSAPNSSISGTLRAPNARIGEIINIAKAAGLSAVDGMSGDGTLTLDVRAQGPTKNMSALNFDGTGKISNAMLKMPSLTKPLQIRNSDIRFSQNSASLQNIAMTLGQTNAGGTLTLKNFEAPQVQFALNADKVNVAELQQIFAATPAQPAKRAGNFWRLIPEANAQTKAEPSLLTKMAGSGTVTIGVIQYDDLLLNNVHANVTLDRGVIRMNPVTADVYGGKENGTITIDMRPSQPVYAVNLKTEKVDANKLISSVSDVKQTLYGMLASNVNASFGSSSASSIARSLNGNMAINLTNGKLMNLDLLHELASVGKFVGNGFGPPKNFTDLFQLTGNFDVKNGLAQTNNLKAVIDGGTLAAAGLVNLADQSLNLHVTAVLNKIISQQVGGTQVGGFMNTALSNNQGELVLPVIVTGTFQHPQVAPDVQQIAKMKLDNLLPTSKNPGQLTTGILGAVLGNKNQNGAAGGNTPQKGGIGGILDAIGGRQPQQNQPQQTASPAVGSNQGQQPQATPTPAPNLGDVLGQVLNRKKKDQATPTPTPPQ